MHPTFTDSSELALIRELQADKPEALSKLYDKYAPVLMGLISRMVPDTETAELVLQKTFAAIWFKRADFAQTNLRFLSWIILVARDVAKAALASRTKGFPIIEEKRIFAEPFASEPAGENPAAHQLQEFCRSLNEIEKNALELVYLKGFSCERAATSLGIRVEEVKECLKTAIKHLGAKSNA